ncbi:MAG: DUF1800 family protein, partial [Novosphingobium sp.]|nr:DUF1800 family protein [Novosphingobium sp.]
MSVANIALNRFGLGARPGQPAPAEPRRWLLEQFGRYLAAPAQLAALPPSPTILGRLATAYAELRQVRAAAGAAAQPASAQATVAPAMSGTAPAVQTAAQANPGAMLLKPFRDDYIAAVAARTAAAVASDTPFVERLVHFWSNHFAVSIDKIRVVGLAGAFEFEAIRPHVLGKFGDMLQAVEQHPAMLLYLDQAESVGPGSLLGQRAAMRLGANGRKVGLNENLAREILELHTLGVRSGYNQADVTEFARALTGWTVGGLGPRMAQATPGYTFA